MKFKKSILIISILFAILLSSCERDVSTLEPATYPSIAGIYFDGPEGGLQYFAFLNSKLDALGIDNNVKYNGTNSVIVTVPSEGDPSGWFAGGAFVSSPRDLSSFNALTFYAKSSQVANIGLVGFGNDNTGDSKYVTSLEDITFTTVWQKYVMPIPNPEKLTAEGGIFQYSIGADDAGNGFNVWFDDIQFEKIDALDKPVATLPQQEVFSFIGDTITVNPIDVNAEGVMHTLKASSAYLDFETDNPNVLSIENGVIKVVGPGTANITAMLGDVPAIGSIPVEVGSITQAPTPTHPAENVISFFSNAYENVTVDSWNPGWQYSTAVLNETSILGNDVKQYTELNFVGIVFTSQTVDISEMTHLHLDIWTPDPTSLPAAFIFEVFDFGADNVFGGSDDRTGRITINANSNPPLVSEQWVSIDVPISSLAGLTTTKNIAQFAISTPVNQNPNTIFIDNLYFRK